MNVLIIGSTGFIGKEIVKQLTQKDVTLTLLVRNKKKAQYLEELNPSRIQLITGDLTLPNLGLNPVEKSIALKSDKIIHCGGPMDITLSEEEAKTAFLNGAKHVAELATEINELNGLQQFIHIVGYMSPFTDDSSEWVNHDVFNAMHPLLEHDSPYEQMKFLADIYIRQVALKSNFPLSVINPPTVIGARATGMTEQLVGFGLFLKIIRQGLLPIVPGGKKYRLPVIHNDVLAKFVIETLFNPSKKAATYTLVDNKTEDLDLPDLMNIVTTALNMKTPKLVAPILLLKTAMTFGGSQLTGVSKTSLNFITDREFDNKQVKNDFKPTLVNELSVNTTLPLVVADIDYTLTFGIQNTSPFVRKSINQTTMYQLKGIGNPIVLFHGLFSEGSDLFPLGIELHRLSKRPLWIFDLPGFGRSPFKKNQDVLTPYLQLIEDIKKETTENVTFIGHSFGAAILLEAIQKNILSTDQQIILLQPPIERTIVNSPIWLNKFLLKILSKKQIKIFFLKQGLFSSEESVPDNFFEKMIKGFKSPRILNTNLMLDKYLSTMTSKQSVSNKVSSIWGEQDTGYQKPANFNIKESLPFGHHFPISQPRETAEVIFNQLKNEV